MAPLHRLRTSPGLGAPGAAWAPCTGRGTRRCRIDPIHAWGQTAPFMHSPSRDTIQVLHEVFGFSSFREGQEEIVRAVLDGEDILAVMPTGAGKSLCYQLPTLARPGLPQ